MTKPGSTLAGVALLGALLGALPAPGTAARAVPAPAPATERAPAAGTAGTAAAERKVIALTNQERRAHGCRALDLRTSLRTTARRHTHRMADVGYPGGLSHQLPGEPGLGRRLTNAGYRSWTMAAENIAYGYPTPRAVVRGWMTSADHRENILDCRLRHIGVGLVRADGAAWWTQDFGRK